MKATGIVGSILVILALIITFLKQVIAFIGFLTLAIKILIAVVFIALFIGVALMVFRGWSERRKSKE